MKNLLNKVIIFILGFIFILSLYNLYKIYNEYKMNKDSYKDISTIVVKDDDEINIQNEEFKKLKEINEDYIFWINIPETKISYPVVKSKDNVDYLNKNFKKEDNKGGSIFVDSRNQLDDDNIIIHGHNMKDKSMFGTLSNLLNEENLNKNHKIYIYLENKVLEYEIFSTYITEGEDLSYKRQFNSEEEFEEYIKLIQDKSINKLEYPEDGERNIITLSTCTNASGPERTIVHGKLKEVKSTIKKLE